MKDREVYCGNAILLTNIPVKEILGMEINVSGNEHATLWVKVVIQNDIHNEMNNKSYTGEKIKVAVGDKKEIIFWGKIEIMQCMQEGSYMEAEVSACSVTKELDRRKKQCSFQDISLTFKQVVEMMMKDNENAVFSWNVDDKLKINAPFIQYEETDWQFLKRLASHFHSMIYPNVFTGKLDFHFGMFKGKEINTEKIEILNFGFSKNYYWGTGYKENQSRNNARYVKIKSETILHLGDTLRHRGRRYTVYQISMIFVRGELVFYYTLGTSDMYTCRKYYNESIAGLRLKGTVRRAEQENLYIQLEMDHEEKAQYGWSWVPETGNLSYCMPEIETMVILYLPTSDEKEGIVVHVLRENQDSERYNEPQNRGMSTIHEKKILIYPDSIEISGKMDKLYLLDGFGIQLSSNSGICLNADESISIIGKQVSMNAPLEIVCKTNKSNIEICRDFNFFAPDGVQTQGTGNNGTKKEGKKPEKQEQVEHWQASFQAMAAIPSMDLAKGEHDTVADMKACGSVAKFAKGSTTVAMKELMEGKKEKDTSFPNAFKAMGAFTVKGGYPVPEGIK